LLRATVRRLWNHREGVASSAVIPEDTLDSLAKIVITC